MPALQKKHKKSSVHNIKSVMNTRFGPSDRIRTCGILLPKQARYQLRYTRKYCTRYYTPFSPPMQDFVNVP